MGTPVREPAKTTLSSAIDLVIRGENVEFTGDVDVAGLTVYSHRLAETPLEALSFTGKVSGHYRASERKADLNAEILFRGVKAQIEVSAVLPAGGSVLRRLLDAGHPYLLIGFGRWGSSDPWLGIPVRWDQIAGARGIVEASLPRMSPEPSQGSHFFHNLSSFSVLYFTAIGPPGRGVDWEWLAGQERAGGTEHVRHVRTGAPLAMRVDGRTRRGVVLRPEGA